MIKKGERTKNTIERESAVPSPTAVAAEAMATGVVPLAVNGRRDEDRVDSIGRAMGVSEEDSGALRTSSELLDKRDRHRAFQEVPEDHSKD
jgi:hypothetical protein